MKYRIMRIIMIVVILNIVFIPFLCKSSWEIGDERGARFFSDWIEDLGDGYSADVSVPIDGLYYLGGLTCALFIFISALRNSPKACTYSSLIGIGISMYLFYEIYLGPTEWYIGVSDAHLSFGFYITWIGFIAVLIASLVKKKE